MRTTVTIDQDVARMLREAMHRSRQTFKQTLNAAVRAGLSERRPASRGIPFVVKARPLGLRPGIDPAGLNRLADDLEIDAVAARPRRAKRR